MELEKLFEVKMIKILIVGLMLISLVTACSDAEKEYTLKTCKNELDANRCNDKCEVTGKVSFKVSKSLTSVMEVYKLNDTTISPIVRDNCKIFDEDSFSCDNDLFNQTISLSDGKYIFTHNSSTFLCGTEIKSIFNPFK